MAGTVVKHVPTRALCWGLIGFGVGAGCVVVSFGLGLWVLGRGALIFGYLVLIPLLIPVLGALLFGLHGLHRGAARAVIELDQKFGLAAYLVDRLLSPLEARLGNSLGNLPLQDIEMALKAQVSALLGSDVEDEGTGMLAYVLRRARRALVPRIEVYLLAAYREEQRPGGSGGGVSLAQVRARTLQNISGRLAELLLAPLNRQLRLFMTLYVLLAGGWWFWLELLAGLLANLGGH